MSCAGVFFTIRLLTLLVLRGKGTPSILEAFGIAPLDARKPIHIDYSASFVRSLTLMLEVFLYASIRLFLREYEEPVGFAAWNKC